MLSLNDLRLRLINKERTTMKYIKVIGKFTKSKFMGSTDEQATVVVLLTAFILIALAVN